MDLNSSYIEAVFYLALIVSAPGLYQISRVVSRYLLNRYFSTESIVVIYKRDGVVVGTKTVKSTGYVVDQLKLLDVRGEQ